MNYTITDINYTGVPEGIQVSTIHPTGIMTLTPDPGYTVSAGNFGWAPNNPYVLDVTFSQSGSNVIATVTFDDGFIMEGSNVEIPLCFNKGEAELIYYTVSGQVYAIGDDHVTSYPGDGINTPFSETSNFNDTVAVYIGTLMCDPGYYMPVPPVLTQTSGSSSNFSIVYNDTYDGELLTTRQYTITYLFPNNNSSNNNFSITALSSEIYVPVEGITNYSVDSSLISAGGDVRVITLIGSVGAAWTLTCVDSIIESSGGLTVTTLSGTIDSNGTAEVTLIFPTETVDTTYSLLLSGDLIVPFPSVNPIIFSQLMDITVTYTTSPNAYFINDGNKYNSGAPYIFTVAGMDGYSNNFDWNITSVNNYGMFLVGPPSPNNFDNTQFTLNGGTSFNPAVISAVQTSSTLIEIAIANSIIQYGTLSFTSTLDLSQFIAYVDTTIPNTITSFTAKSGGIVAYGGTGGTMGYKGICYSVNPLPTVADPIVFDTEGFGSFISNMNNLIASTTYYVRAYGYNTAGAPFYGPEYSFTTEPEYPSTCTVGWDTVNLNVTTYRDGTPIPYVPGEDTAWQGLTTGAYRHVNGDPLNDALYGKMYNGYAVAGIYDAASLANPALRKKFAPTGRIIPTTTDVHTLIDCLGGPYQAGGKMKETGTVNWQSPNVGATNSSGFTSLPCGIMNLNQNDFGVMGYYWTSTTDTANALFYYRNMSLSEACLYPIAGLSMKNGLCVRTIPEPATPDAACVLGFSATNLDVTTYNEGTPLVDGTGLSNAEWDALTVGAWCYPDSNMANNGTYGKIYNWYAAAGIWNEASLVNPALRHNIAPPGSHVPSIAEWDAVITCLGGDAIAAGKLKDASPTYWLSPNTGATNSSGFRGLPGGLRTPAGFSGFRTEGNFYAKDKPDPTNARCYSLYNTSAGIDANNIPEYNGCSIRTKSD